MFRISRLGAALFCCVMVLFGRAGDASPTAEEERRAYARPDTIPFPAEAPYSREIATLGKMLFFDPRLSRYQNMSCATCHNPSFGWEAPVARAIGSKNRPLTRHTPTVLNLAWGNSFFWDGRASTLEEQATGPIQASMEMASDFDLISIRLAAVPDYRSAFERLFPQQGINKITISTALATYERTLVAANAPFDQWVDGMETAISPAAKRGFDLFVGTAGCARCHSGWNFTDGEFYDVGADLALYSPLLDATTLSERPKLKVPTLRNIELRAPYTHLGGLLTLEDVVRHYADSGTSQGIAGMLDSQPFDITDDEISDLVSFLKTLTDKGAPLRAPVLPAQ